MSEVYFKIFIFLCFSVSSFGEITKSDTKLLMVHALFRHGERTTESTYPTDPYINCTYYPIGKGSLTNHGKMQEYRLGQFLRKRYDSFLGDYHTDDIMEVRSTGFGRTRKSALLVLAGLWPPRGEQIWNDELPWQPIPVDYKPQIEDDLLNVDRCARRMQLLAMQPEMPDVKKVYIDPYIDLMSYLSEKTGLVIRTPVDIASLYLTLKTEEGTNLTLPDWTHPVYPEEMYNASSVAYYYLNHQLETRKINTGYLLKKIISDSKSKINGTFGEDKNKIMLYSGHESTVGVLVSVFGLPPHIPNYASAAILELHKIISTNTYAIRILYKSEAETEKIDDIILPGCSKFCPLEKFQEILKDVLPTVPFKIACQPK